MVLTGHAQSIESPNRQLNLTFHVDNGIPYYSLLYKGKIIIEKSRLGFEMKNIPSMVDNFSILKSSTSAFDETWEPVWGEVKKIRNQYNELEITLEQGSPKRTVIIRFRLLRAQSLFLLPGLTPFVQMQGGYKDGKKNVL